MSKAERRLRALERVKKGSEPIIVVQQDIEQPECFTGPGGEQYSEQQLTSLATSATVIKIVYDRE
jgi:hypothetical protein